MSVIMEVSIMLNVLFMAKETLSSRNALQYLCEKYSEIKVVGAVIRKEDTRLKELCIQNRIEICTEELIKQRYAEGTCNIDYIFSFYWKRIESSILQIPRKGSINFHPGPLPEARGSGYHIAILEEWGYWGVTAHYMDEQFDTGAIIESVKFPIDKKIINKDLVQITHEKLSVLFRKITDKLLNGETLDSQRQTQGKYFSIREIEKSKLILPDETAEDVDRKIRAFWNPPHSGAQIEIKGKKYTVINEDILSWIEKIQETEKDTGL